MREGERKRYGKEGEGSEKSGKGRKSVEEKRREERWKGNEVSGERNGGGERRDDVRHGGRG